MIKYFSYYKHKRNERNILQNSRTVDKFKI